MTTPEPPGCNCHLGLAIKCPIHGMAQDQPQVMTLEEALGLAFEKRWSVAFHRNPYTVVITDDFGDDIAAENNWEEAFSTALGRPVAAAPRLAEALKRCMYALDFANKNGMFSGDVDEARAALREAGIE